MVPIGSVVQNITVRYLELPERATIGLEYLPGHIESVHIISSIISQDDIQRAISIVENNDKISIRLTGLFKEQYNVKNSYVKIGKDHIVISKNITTKNEEMGPILDESDALQYIFDRKKYVNEIKDE